jgi:signal transduction histidine kinase
LAGSHVDLTERIRSAQRLQQANAALAKRSEALKKIIQKLIASHRELKETQWRLIQAAKFESAGILAAGVAHEVKNPLQTILMGLDHLDARLPAGDEELAVTMCDMRNAIRRATDIIRELLSLSAAHDFQLRAEDLNSLLERSLLLVQTELSAAHIQVVRGLAPDLPPAMCDHGKIQQVLINLFINAIQAMPQGGTLTVSTRRLSLSEKTGAAFLRQFQPTDRLVAVEVQDTGTGIAEEHLPRIFDPFFTTKPVGIGTGLGLTVTKRIIDLHGGALEIENASPRGVLATIILKT